MSCYEAVRRNEESSKMSVAISNVEKQSIADAVILNGVVIGHLYVAD